MYEKGKADVYHLMTQQQIVNIWTSAERAQCTQKTYALFLKLLQTSHTQTVSQKMLLSHTTTHMHVHTHSLLHHHRLSPLRSCERPWRAEDWHDP